MNKMVSLVKLQINDFVFGESKGRYKNVFMQLTFWVMASSFLFQTYELSVQLITLGFAKDLYLIGVAISSILVFFLTLFRGSDDLFKSNDIEFLLSLPIKSSAVVTSKLIVGYILNFLITCLVMLPILASLIVNVIGMVTLSFFLFYMISIFFVPIIPMITALSVSVFVYLISLKFRLQSLIFVILNLGATALFFDLLFYAVNNSINNSFMAGFYGELTGKSLILITFFAISVLVYSLFVTVVSKKYKSIFSKVGSSVKSNGKREVSLRGLSSQLKSLYKKELKRYFTLPIYVLNTLAMPVILLIGSIALAFVNTETLATFLDVPQLSNIIKSYPSVVEALVISTCLISCVSLSLEGKCKWILDTLPVDNKTVYLSKILVHLTVIVPIVLSSNIFLCVSLKMNFFESAIQFIFPLATTLFCAVVGLLINIKFPSYGWKSETQVIKQSSSVIVSLLISAITAGIPFVVLQGISNAILFLFGYSSLICLVTYFVWVYMCKKCRF